METDERAVATRRLILRDSLAFLTLVLVTAALFAITLFLFRAFTAHRETLARRWSDRGAQAIQADKPGDAIADLRTALTYAPGRREYELLLAEALGEAGRTEESYNYFMGLWETEPGSGPINLQLARLAAKRNDRQAAIDSYRAAINGTWEGDGVTRRAGVRLELARYLIAENEPAAARLELLIAGGNMPETPGFDLTLGGLLEQSGDRADASAYYQKALAARPRDPVALAAMGRLAYRSGDFETAERMLTQAESAQAGDHSGAPPDADDVAMRENAAGILKLMPASSLPARERASRTFAARVIAKKRFEACAAKFAAANELPVPLQGLRVQWTAPEGVSNAGALVRDPALQDAAMRLVYDTELQTARVCSAPTGDDALLLLLAKSPAAHAGPQPQGGSR